MKTKTPKRLEWAILLTMLTLLLAVLFTSCKTQRPPAQIPIHLKEKVVERLVPYALPPDSTTITALFECDSLNNVQLKELSELKAKGLRSTFSFKNGLFNYRLKQPSDTIYISAKDSIIERDVPIIVPSEPIIIYRQTKFEKITGWIGIASIGLLCGAFVGRFIFTIWKLKRP